MKASARARGLGAQLLRLVERRDVRARDDEQVHRRERAHVAKRDEVVVLRATTSAGTSPAAILQKMQSLIPSTP